MVSPQIVPHFAEFDPVTLVCARDTAATGAPNDDATRYYSRRGCGCRIQPVRRRPGGNGSSKALGDELARIGKKQRRQAWRRRLRSEDGHAQRTPAPTSAFRCAAPSSCWRRPRCSRVSTPARNGSTGASGSKPATSSPVHRGSRPPSPIGMSMAELCEAAMTYSDNTAANLILASLGGPAAVTAFARSIGDPVTRLDRIEPALNQALPGDVRDTTTPAAMLKNIQTLVLGSVLSASSKEQRAMADRQQDRRRAAARGRSRRRRVGARPDRAGAARPMTSA